MIKIYAKPYKITITAIRDVTIKFSGNTYKKILLKNQRITIPVLEGENYTEIKEKIENTIQIYPYTFNHKLQ